MAPSIGSDVFAGQRARSDSSVDAIVHEVRQIVAGNPNAGDLGEIATNYFLACRDVNQRLRHAIEWTRRGLFIEARHYVEHAPDALSAAAKLDLGDQWTRWVELCTNAGVPVDLPVDAALGVELSRAYSEWAPREALVTKVRLEALGRASLRQRLATLYQLRVADPNNQTWTDQVRDLETARAREMVREADTTRRAGDIPALRELLREAQNGPWQAGVPHRAVNTVASAASTAIGYASSKRLRELANLLHQAHGNSDENTVGELLAEWRSIIGANEAKPSPEDDADVQPIATWWDARHAETLRIDLGERLCAELDAALADQSPWLAISKIHRSLEDTQVPIPPTLARRFSVRADEHRRAVAARHRLIAIVTCIVLMSAAAGLWWTVSAYSRGKQVESLRASLETALAHDDLSAASLLVEQVRGMPRVAAEPSITPLLTKFDDAWKLAGQNNDAFAAVMAHLVAAKGSESEHVPLIAQAEKLARSPEQKAFLEREQTRLLAERQAFFDDADTKFTALVDTLLARCDASSREIGQRLDSRAAITDETVKRVDELGHQLAELDSAIKQEPASQVQRDAKDAEASVLRRRADEYRERIGHEVRRAARLEKVGGFRGSLSGLATAYNEVLAEFPDGPVARRLSDALKDAAAWSSVDAWITGYSTWVATWNPASDAEAAARSAEVAAIVDKMGSGFDPTAAREYAEYLTRMKALLGGPQDATSVADWRDILNKPRLLELQVLNDMSGMPRRSVGGVLTPVNPEGWFQLSVEIDSFEKLDGAKKPGPCLMQFKPGMDTANLLRPAPEAILSKQLLDAIDACEKGTESWNLLNLQLAILAQKATDADAIYRANLLFYAIRRQANAGWPFGAEIASAKSLLDSLQANSTKPLSQDWLSSASSTIAARQACAAALKALPDLSVLARTSTQRLTDMKTKLRPPKFAGVIWAKAEGPAEYQGQYLTGTVFVVSLGPGDRANLREVGSMKEGVINWSGPVPPVATPILVRN